jgi:PAS domain S-box-containing protein
MLDVNRLTAVSVLGLREPSELPPDQQEHVASFEHAGIGLAVVGPDGRIRRVNRHLAELLGYPPDALVGRSIFEPALADHVDEDQALFRRQARGEIDRYTVEKGFRRSDGGKLWVSVTSSSVRDSGGRFLYAVRVQQDITARRQVEELLARRAEEHAALFQFTEALQHAGRPDEVHACALNAIFRALRCDRAAILLSDSFGFMKLAASRGLSEAYRRAVEGHSPWPSGASDPPPIWIADVASADLPKGVADAARAEGIGALAFVPIVANGRLLGKLITCFDRPHPFARAETDLALTIARQLGVAIDRVRVEAARQRAELAARHLVAIVESSDDAIVSKDLDGVIQTWNRGAERLFGYKAKEVVGKPITIIIPPDRLDEEPKILARIRRGERVEHFETVRRRKDGSLVHISLAISPVRDEQGRVVGASKIARDIADRKAAEARLRDSEHRLKALLEAIPAAIYTTDAQGRITYFNQMAVELAGRVPKLGSDEWCVTWKLYRPDGTPLPHDECPMAVALKEGRPIRNAEAVAERPDGTRVPFIPYPTPLRDADGNIVGAINMLADISERKQAETQQRVLFNELNHRVKNNMQTLQSLLYLEGKKTRNVEAKRILSEASNRIAAMAAAQQIFYSATDATNFNIRDFVSSVCQTVQQTFSRRVNIIQEAGDAVLANDKAMPLALILNELLTNAVKHGLNGANDPTVRVGLVWEKDAFVLYVEDDGPGFELESVRPRSSGLQLVQGLARQLGGKFTVTRDGRTRCSVQFR